MDKHTIRNDRGMIFELKDGRKVYPIVMGQPQDAAESVTSIKAEQSRGTQVKGWLLVGTKYVFDKEYLVSFSLSDVINIMGSYTFPPL